MGTRLREAEPQQSLAVALFECFGEVKCWYEKVLLCWPHLGERKGKWR